MPSLKLVSIHANPCRLIRTIATSARPKSSKSSLGLNVRTAGKLRPAEKMPPCAPLVFRNSKLGFRGCNSLSSSSSHVADSHSSDDKAGDFCQNGGLNKQEDRSDDERQPSKLLTLPTVLTIARVAAVPLLVNTFYMDSRWGTTATTSIFVLASITDWLDGYLARKMKLSSQFGAFLDPVADKLMVATTLILLCTKPLAFYTFGQVPWLLTVPAIAIIGREITMSAVREWAASQDSKLLEAVAVNSLGKWKTATQMTALTILLAARDSSLVGYGGLVATGVALLYVSAWLAVWSLFVYMRKISKVLFK